MLRLAARKQLGAAARNARGVATSQSAGVSIASVDDGRAVSELDLVVNAGSRFETSPGVARLLADFAFRDTARRSALRLTRESELLGGRFGSVLGHEKLVLQARFLREDLPYFVEALANVAKSTSYKPHELVEEVLPRARLQAALARKDALVRAYEAVRAVAFHGGLGNSILVPENYSASVDEVREFGHKVYNKGNLKLYARGVPASDLDEFVGTHFEGLTAGSELKGEPSKFYGGEARLLTNGPEHVVVLAFPSTVLPAVEVLQYVLDSKPVKWSPGVGLLNSIADSTGTSIDVNSHNYSDASLLTVAITGPRAEAVADAARKSAEAIKKVASSGVEDAASKRAHNCTKFARAEQATDLRIADLLPEIDSYDVQKVAKELLKGKVALSAVGHIHKLPHVDELF